MVRSRASISAGSFISRLSACTTTWCRRADCPKEVCAWCIHARCSASCVIPPQETTTCSRMVLSPCGKTSPMSRHALALSRFALSCVLIQCACVRTQGGKWVVSLKSVDTQMDSAWLWTVGGQLLRLTACCLGFVRSLTDALNPSLLCWLLVLVLRGRSFSP